MLDLRLFTRLTTADQKANPLVHKDGVYVFIFIVFGTVEFTVNRHIQPGWTLMEIKVDMCEFRRS